MTDGKTEEDQDQSTAEHEEPRTKQETSEATVPTVASSLAGMFLEHQVRKGREIEIPSLGIKVGKPKSQSMKSKGHDNANGNEEPPNHASASS
jgi:hypothetical protein